MKEEKHRKRGKVCGRGEEVRPLKEKWKEIIHGQREKREGGVKTKIERKVSKER